MLSSKKLLLRYSEPPLIACTNEPIKPAAKVDSNNTGHSMVASLRERKRLSARSAA